MALNTPCMALVHACTGGVTGISSSWQRAAVPCCRRDHSLMDCLRAAFVDEQVEGLLERSSAPPAGEEPGPDSELEHCRQQMSRLNSLTEQLKSHECRLVLGVTSMAHSQVGEDARSAWACQTCLDCAEQFCGLSGCHGTCMPQISVCHL